MEEWDPADNDLYLDVIAAGEQTSMSKSFVPHAKNIIVKNF
jgi:hypothetical protein